MEVILIYYIYLKIYAYTCKFIIYIIIYPLCTYRIHKFGIYLHSERSPLTVNISNTRVNIYPPFSVNMTMTMQPEATYAYRPCRRNMNFLCDAMDDECRGGSSVASWNELQGREINGRHIEVARRRSGDHESGTSRTSSSRARTLSKDPALHKAQSDII